MSKDLDHRTSRAKHVPKAHANSSGETPELPFEPVRSDQAATRRPGRPARAREAAPQHDLFASAEIAETPSPAEPVVAPQSAQTSPESVTTLPPAPEPEPPEEPFEGEPFEEEPETDRSIESRILDPQSLMLTRVNPGNLRPTDRPDSYLYHVTNAADASSAMRHGITISASDPIILTERQGVAYWLAALAEDYDFILDGPADFVVLRMRRHAVEDLLESDASASRSAGCPCYLLTGSAAARSQ